MLILAAVLCVFIGVVHSYRGERFILIRLFRKPLPPLCGNDHFTRKTLRLAWHITTVAWCNFAAILLYISPGLNPVATSSSSSEGRLMCLRSSRSSHLEENIRHGSFLERSQCSALLLAMRGLLSHTDTLSVTLICRPQFARCGNELYSLRLRFRRHNAILES